MRRAGTDAMTCSRMMIVIWILVQSLPSGCSHQQPPAAKRTQVAVGETLAVPNPRPPAAPPEDKPASAFDPRAKIPEAIFFEFDSALLREDSQAALVKIAREVSQRDNVQLAIEGNCDDLGTVEYNLALGQQRAEAAKQYLVHMGVPQHRITTASYGSQRPKYPGQDEVSRAKNRRDDLVFRNLRDRR